MTQYLHFRTGKTGSTHTRAYPWNTDSYLIHWIWVNPQVWVYSVLYSIRDACIPVRMFNAIIAMRPDIPSCRCIVFLREYTIHGTIWHRPVVHAFILKLSCLTIRLQMIYLIKAYFTVRLTLTSVFGGGVNSWALGRRLYVLYLITGKVYLGHDSSVMMAQSRFLSADKKRASAGGLLGQWAFLWTFVWSTLEVACYQRWLLLYKLSYLHYMLEGESKITTRYGLVIRENSQ